MNEAAEFLNALAHALAAMRLYGERHTAWRRAVDHAFDTLVTLLARDPAPAFSFLDGEVIFANERLRELRAWKWTRTLAGVGVERLQVRAGATRDELERFLQEVRRRVDRGERATPESNPRALASFPHIEFGQLGVDGTRASGPAAMTRVAFDEEAEATQWLFGEASRNGEVSGAVAEAVVRSLGMALHEERDVLGLLLPLRETDEYTTVHSLNVCILSMAAAEALGHGGPFVKQVGEAALRHDVGKGRIPREILQKPGALDGKEWDIVKRHPADGARILINSGPQMELAAVVAYEHHARWNGGGYPTLRRGRRPHPVSQLVQICDVYDALRTRRPFRGPWRSEDILRYLHDEAGSAFDPHSVAVFTELLARWSPEGGGAATSGS